MPFNGTGMFVRLRNWVADAAAGVRIRADYHDIEDDGFADGLSQCIARDGQSVIINNIPMNGKRITGLQDPVDPQDAVTKAYDDLKLPLTGGTITGNLTVTGSIKAIGYNTRAGVAGVLGANVFNFNYVSGNLEAWVDSTNLGALATQAFANNAANTAAANAAAPKVNRAGDTMTGVLTLPYPIVTSNIVYFSPSSGYLQWNGGGTYTFGSGGTAWHNGNLTPVTNVRLLALGNIGPGNGTLTEYAGAVVTGLAGTIVGTTGVLAVTSGYARWLQYQTPGGWFTVATA